MSKRINIDTGTTWEAQVGYSRAVRVGNTIMVAGTTAVDEHGALIGGDDVYEQARFIWRKIEKALHAVGASFEDVVRTVTYVTDISQWQAVGKAHHEIFHTIRPAATMVEIKALTDPALLIEIEVTAIVQE